MVYLSARRSGSSQVSKAQLAQGLEWLGQAGRMLQHRPLRSALRIRESDLRTQQTSQVRRVCTQAGTCTYRSQRGEMMGRAIQSVGMCMRV